MDVRTWIRDVAEKAVATLAQHGLVFVAVVVGLDMGTTVEAAAAAGVAGVVTLVVNMVPLLRPRVTTWAADLGLRLLRTAVATVGGLATLEGFDVFDADSWRGALSAAAVAALVVVKAEIARRVPNTVTPASLAPAPPTGPTDPVGDRRADS